MTRRWCVALVLAMLASLTALDAARGAPLIAIDGHFEDWEGIPIAARDPVDPVAVLCDFREVRIASDPAALFLDVRFQNPVLIRVSGGTVGILIDADGDSTTGWTERGLSGVDLVIQGKTGGRQLLGDNWSIEVRVWPPDTAPPPKSTQTSLARIGIMRAPAYESDRIEIRVPRGISLPTGTTPPLIGDRARIKIVSILRDGIVVDEIGPIAIGLVPFARERPQSKKQDPLARQSSTRLRVLEWNVSHRSLADRADRIGRILSVLRPDLLLLNEVSDGFSSEEVRRVLEQAGIASGSGARVVYGRGGGEERAVVAGRFLLTELPRLVDLKYPLIDVRRFLPPDQPPEEFVLQADQGIQVAGAVATIADQRILLVSLGLESRGRRPFEIEEYLRRIQAMTIASAMARSSSESSFDMVIVAGDFNLVVTERPLLTLASKTETTNEPLRVINALQLDGESNATWANPGLRYAAGRLDFMLYSAPALELDRAFVFDSRDLSPHWLRHHGLDEDISSEVSDHLPIVADFSW